MEVNSVSPPAQVDPQTLNTENRETRASETNEAPEQSTPEAYQVNISQEALQSQSQDDTASSEPVNSVEQGSEAVQTYTRGGQIAG